MGHKGVSKRKPKKDRPFTGADIGGAANGRAGEQQPVASAVKDNRAALNTGGMKPSAGSSKNHHKGN